MALNLEWLLKITVSAFTIIVISKYAQLEHFLLHSLKVGASSEAKTLEQKLAEGERRQDKLEKLYHFTPSLSLVDVDANEPILVQRVRKLKKRREEFNKFLENDTGYG
jgi:hypothetical protein